MNQAKNFAPLEEVFMIDEEHLFPRHRWHSDSTMYNQSSYQNIPRDDHVNCSVTFASFVLVDAMRQ